MQPKIGETITLDFIVHAPATGFISDADETPTHAVYQDDGDTPLTLSGVTLAKRSGTTGHYRLTLPVTTTNGFTAAHCYSVVAHVTVDEIDQTYHLATLQPRAKSLDDEVSIDSTLQTKLEAVYTRTSGGVTISLTSPVADTGEMTLRQGDDYASADGQAIAFVDEDHGLTLSGASVALVLQRSDGSVPAGDDAVSIAGAISEADTDATYAFDLTSTLSSGLACGAYRYAVKLTLANGHILTRANGEAQVETQTGFTRIE